MAKRIDQVLYFSIDFDVDWTNNSCEQAIRMAKLCSRGLHWIHDREIWASGF